MATRVLRADAPNQNYADGTNFLTNGVAGTAPMPGDTVVLNVAPANGPITATNLAISGETIQLSNNAQFFTAGTTSFDATTSLTDTNTSGVGTDIQFGNGLVNNGTITNAAAIFLGTQTDQTNTPLLTNNGTFNYTTNTTGQASTTYTINGFNSSNIAEITNAGAFNVVSTPGTNQGLAPQQTTYLAISGVFNETSTGSVNVTGSAPNTTGFAASGATESVVEFEQGVTGTGTYNLNDGEIQFDAASSGNVNFGDASSILDLANVTNVAETLNIAGFRAGDAIGLGTTAITRAAYDATTGKIDLFNGATMVSAITLLASGTQNLATATYSIVPVSAVPPDGQGNNLPTTNSTRNQVYLETNLAAPCYCPGTLIRTDRGDVAVEQLAIGDRLITLGGSAEPIKWIGRRAFAGRFVEGRRDILPVCIRAGALGTGLPRRDLWVSPLHAMYLDGALVPASALVNDATIIQADAVERVDYIHVELERHQVIWAEDAASESFVDDYSRAMFHNAQEFAALYPDAVSVPAIYCAPRVEAGEALAAIKRGIDRRAGLAWTGADERLQGRVDALEGQMLSGWAQNPDKSEVPVCLEVLVDGVAVARAVANGFRADLLAAGLGSGCHSFRLRLPKAAKQARIEVRRMSDGKALGTLDLRKRAAA